MARALGALLHLSPADPTAPPPVSLSSRPSSGWGPSAVRPAAAASSPAGQVDPWAVDPILDGATLITTAGGGTRSEGGAEVAAAAQAAVALQESGFGGALHTALGELRRIADDPVAAGAGSSPPQSVAQASPWPPTEPASPSERLGGDPGAWLASLHDWWTARWKDLLPGIVVATLVVVAFAVVLASGTRRADTSHVDTRRPIASDPSTTVPGLFATEAPSDPTTSAPTGFKSGSSTGPVTTRPALRPAVSSAPPKTSTPAPTSPAHTPPPTRPTATTAPTTTPPPPTSPTTTAPEVTTTVPPSQ